MKILAIEKEIPGVNEQDYIPHLESEAIRAWELYQSGHIRELYFTDDNSAVLILEADTSKDAKEIIDSLPLVKAGLIDFEIIPLKAYPGFKRLFKNENVT